MFKILLACDGSEDAMRATRFVARLCREAFTSSEITVLYAKDLDMAALGLDREARIVALPDSADMERRMDSVGESCLREAAEVLRETERPLVLRTEWGRAADVICRIASEDKFDLVVMGKRGMSRIGDIFLGSVSDRVLNCCGVPVLIVHQ